MSNCHSIPSRVLPLLAFAALLTGCVSTAPHDQLTVFGAGESRAKSAVPAYRLRSYGTWGAGMLTSGKADMIFDGLYYHRLASGKAAPLTASETLSEGWATRFRPDSIEALPENFDLPALLARLNKAVPDGAMPCAFRIVGEFAELAIASPAGNAIARNAPGALYGYRCPWRDGKPRVELWFLSSDRSAGGRVTGFKLVQGSLAIDLCPSLLTLNTATSRSQENLK